MLAQTKDTNLTTGNLVKVELYKERFPLNRGKSPTNTSLADSYDVDSKTVTNILAKVYEY